MFGFDIRRPELAGFVARKKDNAPSFFRITFKHKALPPWLSRDHDSSLRPSLGNHWPQGHYAIKLPPRLWPGSAFCELCPVTKETRAQFHLEHLQHVTSVSHFSISARSLGLCHFPSLLARKRLRRNLFHAPALQTQHSVAAPR